MFNITLESVLQQHSDAISSVEFGIRSDTPTNSENPLHAYCLISSSFDFNVCIWKPDETGLWSVETTLGAMVGNKHAFFGAKFLEDDKMILAYTYNGAFH